MSMAASETETSPVRPEPGSTTITDELMLSMRAKSRPYTLLVLTATPALRRPEVDPIIWEHGRRNHALRAEGLLAIVCPVVDDTALSGIGLFNTSVEEAARIMDGDPAVKAGIFTYEVHPVVSFPGDSLPGEPSPTPS